MKFNKVAVISGGWSGIGRAFVKRLHCTVSLTYQLNSGTHMQIQKLISGTLLSATLLLTSREAAAQLNLPPPPSLPLLPSTPPAFSRNVDAELAAMTGRYGLSSDQQAKVRTILAEQAKKVDEAVNAQSLSPPERLTRLKAVKDEEVSRVSAVLTAEQKKKYAQDVVSPLPGAPSGNG